MQLNNNISTSDSRIICWFSCGAASAVATKLTLTKYPNRTLIVYNDMFESEHPDNLRFFNECQNWFNHKIIILKQPKYKTIWDCFIGERYLVGPKGAKCTVLMKKVPRFKFQLADDIHVLGYHYGESNRITNFINYNPEILTYFPLIKNKLDRSDCYAILDQAGIDIPTIYKLGFNGNNCLGCVKCGAGYWNKLRKHFPQQFNLMAAIERDLNATILKRTINYKTNKLFLDELPKDFGNYNHEPIIQCSVFCASALSKINT